MLEKGKEREREREKGFCVQVFLHCSCRLGDVGQQLLQCTVITEFWKVEWENH